MVLIGDGWRQWDGEMVRRGGASTAVREFWWLGRAVKGSCSWRRRREMRGGQWRRAMMAEGGSSLKRVVGGGVPPTVGRGQEEGGEVVLVACLRRRKRGENKRGVAASGGAFYTSVRGEGQVGGRRHTEARSGGGAWRCTRATLSAGSGPATVGASGRRLSAWPALNRGEAGADWWAPLQSNTV
jgi:hypothetical protein